MEQLRKIPFGMFFVLYLLYVGYQYFEFEISSDGDLSRHTAQLGALKSEVNSLKQKLSEGEKFTKTLEAKKEDIRLQVKKLSEYQGVLSENLNVPELIKVLITETRRIQLKLDRIEPGRQTPKEYYLEQEFRMQVKGSFVQMVLLSQRIAQLQRILRIESFSFKPFKNSLGRSSGLLEADISIIGYQYSMSNEDSIARPFR